MQLNVRKINQMASGGSYVVVYEADLDILETPTTTVEVLAVEPSDTAPELIELARLAILEGAEHVLAPAGRGALILVRQLVINAVDFKAYRLAMFTAHEIRVLLGQGPTDGA